jgi:pimeloyl-ACP methyl ester carboxylesterase
MRPLAAFHLAIFSVLAYAGSAAADLIFLKDGFVLQGKVKREGTVTVDNGQPVWMPQGFFLIDADCRRLYFSPGQVQEVDAKNANTEIEVKMPVFIAPNFTTALPPLREVIDIGNWDEKWDRSFQFRTFGRQVAVTQHLSFLSPTFARMDVLRRPTAPTNYYWSFCYHTRELGPANVQRLLDLHQDYRVLKDKSDEENASRRVRAFQFLAQAGWYDAAADEIKAIRKAWPAQKEKADIAAVMLSKVRAFQLVDDAKRAAEVGQHTLAQKLLAEFPEDGADDKSLAQVRALRLKYDAANEHFKYARGMLCTLSCDLDDTTEARSLADAATAIAAEIRLDHFLRLRDSESDIGRLDTFIAQAKQVERQLQAGANPVHTREQLLALAITGWLLGNSASEDKVESAMRLWKARQFVLKQQQTESDADRRQLVQEYETQKDAISAEELAQMIPLLPPPEPAEVAGKALRDHALRLSSQQKVTYTLQLPPEYHHGRAYPVLCVLHATNEKPKAILERWSPLAAQNGYLLVAPEWDTGVAGNYRYTAEEHAAVLESLRDLRRRYQVDSDRVFLAGVGQGGNMAYDLGLSHPDQFAGVLPMSAQPGPFARYAYWRNAQYLPFYVVDGDHAGETHRDNIRQLFTEWIPRGYPAMSVEYKGRGLEWFAGEMWFSFDWMSRKKRAFPLPQLGKNPGAVRGEEMQTMRATDNRFYWLSTDGIYDRHLNDAARWNANTFAATLYGKIGDGNVVNLTLHGVKNATVWFSRGMIDFDKPVTIYVNLQVSKWNQKKVPPSAATLLEDLYQKGDRQRLFLARVDLDRV